MRCMDIAVTTTFLSLGIRPKYSPRSWTLREVRRVMTLSPWASWSSIMGRYRRGSLFFGRLSLVAFAPRHLSGKQAMIMKSGASSSSIASRSPLATDSQKRRTRALFFSSSTDAGAASSLPTCVPPSSRRHA